MGSSSHQKLLRNPSLLLKSISWNINEASTIIYCDACPSGMGFWYPKTNEGFISPTPSDVSPQLIFYFEALCVLSALYNTHQWSWSEHIVIYTDNLNTVNIFNSFRTLPSYNHLLKAAVNILTSGDHELRVLHILGTENQVADALSRLNINQALTSIPNLKIIPFQPWTWMLRLMINKEVKPPVLAFGTEQV